MRSVNILGIDPGNVTGGAWYSRESGDDHASIGALEIPDGLDGLADWLDREIPAVFDLVVIEDFVVNAQTHRKTREPDAMRGVGYAMGWAHIHGVPSLVIPAAEHKGFSKVNRRASENKIVRLGWGERTLDGHGDDALSLVLYGLTRHYPEEAAPLLRSLR